MAVRWKAGQRRKRWTEQAVAIPRGDGLIRVQEFADESAAAYLHFARQLQSFGQLPSTFAQIAATKALSDALLPALKCTPTLVKAAMCAYVELLFLENSRPLHRGLLSTLSRLSKDMENLVADALCVCCLKYGEDGGIKHRRFSCVGVVASVANLPQPGILKGVIQQCLNLLTLSACSDVAWVLECCNQGGRPPPNTMEDCQDAMGSLYYMLQHYPHCFTQLETTPGMDETSNLFIHMTGSYKIPQQSQSWVEWPRRIVYGIVFQTLVDVLETSVLSRDCVVAAGVGLCAAVQLHNTSEQVALLLVKSIFASPETQHVATLSSATCASSGTVEASMAGERSLSTQVSKFTEFGRLCVLRGLLTALPRPALNIPLLIKKDDIPGKEWKVWTILYDGVLPALCALCEGSVDSHFKFHTVTALQICLQQVRASVTGNLIQDTLKRLDNAGSAQQIIVCEYDPLPSTMISRVLQIVWNNWEDPLTQTVKQVQAVFDILVDVQFVFAQQRNVKKIDNVETANGDFVKQIATNLLAEGRYRKGKYVPLASLALRIGALNLLSMNPDLLFDTFLAQSDDDVCCSASSFLKTFLERLKEDCWSSHGGVMEGELAFRRLWIPPLLSVLLSGNARLRSNLNTYALPVAMRIDPDSVIPIVAFILDGAKRNQDTGSLKWDELEGVPGLPSPLSMHQRIAALISVLKVARSLALIDGDIEENLNARLASPITVIGDRLSSLAETVVVRVQNEPIQIPVLWLEQALTHLDDSLRVDTAELICLNPKTASMPSSIELQMLLISIPLNMRCSSTSFRMRWTSLLKKFFNRVRTAAWRQHRVKLDSHSVSVSSSAVSYGDDKKKRAVDISGQKEVDNSLESKGNEGNEQLPQSGVTISEIQEFMQLLSQYLLSSLYPSAPYERKNMAMELLNAIFEVWSLSPGINPGGVMCPVSNDFSPYQAGLLSAEATLVVVGAIVDSWDKLRESAFRILVQYPTPLPGLESKISIERIIHWAKGLVCSPRVRESDAGALVLRLIFRKYVLGLGWSIDVHSVAVDTHLGSKSEGQGVDRVGPVIAEYMESLNDWLEWGIEEGDRDLVKACSHSFVHGVLLTLRYTMEELPWTSVEVQLASSQLMAALHNLISLLLRVTSLTLWVVSANALNLPLDMTADSQAGGFDDILAVDADNDNFEEADGVAPVEQMIMVGCWLSMKEVSLLLGTIAREVPLSGGSTEVDNGSQADAEGANGLLNTGQLEAMGEHFLQVLLAMKHNGAIDKTRAGFIALCDRLLRSSDPRLNKLPETWMQQLLERTGAKGQTVDNLLRRSAGIPAAFLALFLAEPDGAPKKLLPMAMSWLIDTSKKFVCASKKEMLETAALGKSTEEDFVCLVKNQGENLEIQERMKVRDEGVVPTVHAFNAMRVAFHDTNLATDTSGFCAEGLITTIQAFSCPYWEVRNSATLAFTALVHRMIGFLNVYKRESARRAITGFEFFHRFPTLHPFLLEELCSATLQLQRNESNRGYRGHGMASTLHPSLGPVLIILSRLKPSVISAGVGDWLSPSAFRSYVTSCATEANLHVRVLASQALAPLVSSEDLPKVLLELAQSLPCSPGPIHVLSYNEVHGVLLQMAVLLNSNCLTLPNLDMRRGIMMHLMTVLEHCWWLGSIQHCKCYMVVGAFFSMLEGMMNVAKSCSQAGGPMDAVMSKIQTHLLQLCSECLEDVTDDGIRWAESMQVTLKERAAKLYFSTALTAQSSQSNVLPMHWGSNQNDNGNSVSEMTVSDKELLVKDLGQMFRCALTHQMYEVRLGTLKVLKEFSLPSGGRTGWISSFLQPLLVERLNLETHPGCIRRILHVIFSWRALPRKQSSEVPEQGQMDGNRIGWDTSSLVLWDRILHIYRTSKHTKTKEVALRCMGACLNQMRGHVCQVIEDNSETISSVDFTNWEHVKGAVDDWIALVNKHSAANESVNFRRATVEAVVASGLLEQVSWVASRIRADLNETLHEAGMTQWYGKSLLQLWCVCVKLLEDEDPELRQTLALSLQEVLLHLYRTEGSTHVGSAVPSQVEHVVQLVFQCMSEHFGTWKVYWEVLAKWVLGFEDITALPIQDVDLVRRLFDKEIDNHHEEELVFVQLCCRHLRQLVCYYSSSLSSETQVWSSAIGSSSVNLEGKAKFLTVWRERFLEQAKLCAELTVCMQEKMSWVGGVTNHQDAFKMVYRRLLGLLTFAGPCADNQKEHVRTRILEISRLLQQLPLNPLVSNLMYKVLQAYEKHLAIDLCSSAYRLTMGVAFCDKFEPLFLIE